MPLDVQWGGGKMDGLNIASLRSLSESVREDGVTFMNSKGRTKITSSPYQNYVQAYLCY